MELMMFAGNDCIDSVEIKQKSITLPGYLGNLVKQLKEKHQQLFAQMQCEPEFLIRSGPTQNKRLVSAFSNPGKFEKDILQQLKAAG